MIKETLESPSAAPAAAGHIPPSIPTSQPDTLQACGQKSQLLFFSQPFLCLKWTFKKEKVRNEQSTGTAHAVSQGQMCDAFLPNSLLASSLNVPFLVDTSTGPSRCEPDTLSTFSLGRCGRPQEKHGL